MRGLSLLNNVLALEGAALESTTVTKLVSVTPVPPTCLNQPLGIQQSIKPTVNPKGPQQSLNVVLRMEEALGAEHTAADSRMVLIVAAR